MKVIGFRNSPTLVRYAILDIHGDKVSFKNARGEHILEYPLSIDNVPDKLDWLFKEVTRVFELYDDTKLCALKCNEFIRRETTSTRYTAYADAIVLLASRMRSIPVEYFLYKQIGLTSSEVMTFAEAKAGTCNKRWDTQIADAIAVAYCLGAKNG